MKILVRKSNVEFLACILAAFVFTITPWDEIYYRNRGWNMVDRMVYEDRVLSYNLPVDFFEFTHWYDYVLQEFLWNHLLASSIRVFDYTPDEFFTILTFCTSLAMALMVRRLLGLGYVILLLNPLVVDFTNSQFRLAVAVAILFVAYLLKERQRTVALVLAGLTPLIHTASVIFLSFLFLALVVHPRNDKEPSILRHLLPLVMAGATVSILIGPMREVILGSIGDRRAEYSDMSSSIAYLSFWLFLYGSLLLDYRRSLMSPESRVSLVILSLVAVNVLTGGYSSRFIVASLPFLIYSMVTVFGPRNILVLSVFIAYAVVQWLFWFKI